MELLVILVLGPDRDDGPVSQATAKALQAAGLEGEVKGRKGPVSLPANAWAAIVPLEAATRTLARQELERTRDRLVDTVSTALDRAGYTGTYFLTVSEHWSWGYRPVPRKRKNRSANRSDRSPAVSTSGGKTSQSRTVATAIRLAASGVGTVPTTLARDDD